MLKATYTYSALEQLAIRVLTNMTPSGTIHSIYDLDGNLIVEANDLGQTVREYVWNPETEIAPTSGSRAPIARPIAVVDGVNGLTPALYHVQVDHLNRPIRLTNAAKAAVWTAVWKPFGEPQSITGAASLDARFPGQWFQVESGLAYNWHRHYDASTGRYAQPDPLGFVDGPGVNGYARQSPQLLVDPDGRIIPVIIGGLIGFIIGEVIDDLKDKFCVCSDDSKLRRLAYGGLGALYGGFGPTDPFTKPRMLPKPFHGMMGSPWTSWWSKETFPNRKLGRLGRPIARAIPGLGIGLLTMDL